MEEQRNCQTRGKAGFFPPINKMIAVKKTKPQQLLTVKSTGFLQLHPRAQPALPIKYKNKLLFSGTRPRSNPTSSHSKEKKKSTKYPNKRYLLNKKHKPLQFLQALCSHHSCPASPPHSRVLQGKRTSRQQQYMCEKVTRQTGRGQVPADRHWQPPTHWGGQTALLQPPAETRSFPRASSSCSGHLPAKHCTGQGPLLWGSINTVRTKR